MTSHTIVFGDARSMPEIPDSSAHLMVTSPPYWSLKEYGKNQQIGFSQGYEQYIADISSVMQEAAKKIIPGRFACLVVGTAVSDQEMKSIPSDIINVMRRLGFTFKKEIIWVKPKGVQGLWQRGTTQFLKRKPFPCHLNINIIHEYILIFQKDGPISLPELNNKNKLQETFIKAVAWSVWQLDVSKTKGHPAPFPDELAKRLILLYSFEGETILDPFLGSGTVVKVARESNRNSYGYEINMDYKRLIEKVIGLGQTEFQLGGVRPTEIHFVKRQDATTSSITVRE